MTENELRGWGFFLFLVFIFSGDPDIWDAVKNKILVWGEVAGHASQLNSEIGQTEITNEDA